MEKYKDDIIKLITERGPLGVNAIQRELGMPLSTLQKYLHRQNYFKLNDDRKWDLPENVIGEIKTNTLSLMTNVVENSILLLKSQMEEMQLTIDNALSPIITLKKGVNNIALPVADKGNIQIDPRLVRVSDDANKYTQIVKAQKGNIPDEYKDIVFSFDLVGLVLKEGEEYVRESVMDELSAVLVGKNSTLSEELIQTLKENQKGAI